MTRTAKQTPSDQSQSVCIDLPGEQVQCWRSADKIKVVLRKHRDVIFEIKLGNGRQYTVESNGSDFYHADEKRLIPGRGKASVSFNDGIRLHLWVSRDFKGELLLKSAGKLVLKFEPQKLDVQQYNGDPTVKPDPIIISLGPPSESPESKKGRPAQQAKFSHLSNFNAPQSLAAPVEEDCTVICVIDGDLKGMPADIWNGLKNGGGDTGFADFDPFNIATRNWLLAQLAGAAAYTRDNWEWLRASLDGRAKQGFKLVKATIHYVRGKARYYFSGYSKYNTVFGPGGFGSGHDRITSIFCGVGKNGSVFNAAIKGVAGTFKGNALVSFIFSSSTAMAEWKNDITKDGYDLASTLLMGLLKAIFSAAIVVAIVACIVMFIMFFMGASLSVIAIGAMTVGVGVAVNYGVELLDKKLGEAIGGESNQGGLSALLAERMRRSVEYHWYYLKKKLLWDYEEVSF